MNICIRKALPALVALGLLTTATWAQTPPADNARTPSANAAAAALHAKRRAAFVEQRIKQLHAQLKITSEQTKQWDAYAQTMRENARHLDQAFQERASKLSSMNAVDAMNSYADLAGLHAENMQKLATAFRTLYETMSPEQKRNADKLFRTFAERRRAAMHKPKAAASRPKALAPAPDGK
jgi:LTXXQ motif family protein